MVFRIVAILVLSSPCVVLSQVDEVEGPWGTAAGNIAGTSTTEAIDYLWGAGPMQVAWRLDVRAEGQDRAGGRNPITFDAAGNTYWKTNVGGQTGGTARVVSASPDGAIRWVANDGAGGLHHLGAFFDTTAVVVGKDVVYALGAVDTASSLFVVAYRKDTGATVWETELDDSATGASGAPAMANLLTPVLYAGKLYIVVPSAQGLAPFPPQNVYQVNAADGKADWMVTLDGIVISVNSAMTFIPNAFAAGEHGLYFNGESGAPSDGIPDVYGARILGNGARLAWSAEGGKVARSHLVYSLETNILYAHTWNDYGGSLYTYDPVTGPLQVTTVPDKTANHGFYDVGCLDFNGTDIIVGGADGAVYRYSDQGSGAMSAAIAFDDDSAGFNWWGEYRTYGQLLRAPGGNSVLISGTNSRSDLDPANSARIVAIDVTAGALLWEFDTGVIADHGFTIRGGPLTGPDGKVYYFDNGTGELVALKGPAVQPKQKFKRGDTNADQTVNIADAVCCLSYLFGKADDPCKAKVKACLDAADANNDESLNIADAIKILGHLFAHEGPLPDPFAACGEDTAGTTLGCESFTPCPQGG